MNAQQTDTFKQQLLEEKTRLEALVGRTAKHLYRREEPYNADFAEQAVETQNNEVVEQIDREAQVELVQIGKALERIENGSYGICANCGETINEKRLQAIPYTENCITCADQ